MLYNFQRKRMCRHLLVGGALLAAGMGMYSCSDDYRLDDEKPSGINNIYGYMKDQGNFTNYLHLIDDLGLSEILSKTGSKTMFIADDDAFAKFYASNSWGVKSYEGLTLAQKKLLLNSSMIDNPYSTTMLSSAESQGTTGRPVKGEVCRRSSSQSLLDSVMVLSNADDSGIMPDNPLFNEVRANHESIVLFNDASTAAPMVHFTGKFVTVNKLANSDIDFIYNQPEGTFQTDDVYVNDARVINSNIFCLNGFIHQVDKVIVPLDNMAEIIRKNPKTTTYSGIIERFAAPDDSLGLTRTYNLSYGTEYDSIFVKRYFSDRSAGSTMSANRPFNLDKNGKPFDDGNTALKYDPGWNGYIPYISNDRQPMMEDLAVMLVPTDAAINEWWNNGGGQVIKNYYGSIDDTPNSVLDKLIRVNQLESFVGAAPSHFSDVMDDANEKLGITKADVDSVIIGCNGMVFLTNKVFTPASYSSVLFPAVIDTTSFKILSNAISNLNYDKYLNSPVSNYVFLLPTNNGMLTYIDPVSYGLSEEGGVEGKSQMWQFHLDLSKAAQKQLYADVYDCIIDAEGNITREETKKTTITGGTDNAILKNRIENLLDNIIVVLDEGTKLSSSRKYYKTKARTFVRIEDAGNEYKVYGSYQNEVDEPFVVSKDKAYKMNNGITIPIEGVVMGTRKSVFATLNDQPEFSDFAGIIKACAVSKSNSKDEWQAGDQLFGNLFTLKEKGSIGAEDTESNKGKATYLLNNYNYTVYAPTNAAMQKAYEAGLPTLEDLDEAEQFDDANADLAKDDPSVQETHRADSIREVMLDFVKYHIQDNSIFVDEGFESADYESGKTELIKSVTVNDDGIVQPWNGKYSPGRPYKLKVKVSAGSMTVTDCRNGYDPNTKAFLGGVTANVVTKPGFYNLMAHEYWYKSKSKVTSPYNTQLDNSSSVVIQGIDSPLIFADGKHYDSNGQKVETQFTYSYKPLSSDKK